MEIIPAIDIKNGRCVRLFQGNFTQETVYDDNPLAVARRWVEQGATRLHVVDLDGARAGQPIHVDVIGAIVRTLTIPVQVGGGMRTEDDVEQALKLGAARVILGTAAVHDPELITHLVARYPDAIIVGVDARDGMVATAGWLETAAVEASALVQKMAELGVRRFIYTDISRDGTLSEPNYAATAQLIQAGGPAVIASGGIANSSQLQRLAEIGCEGAIVGRALYTGDIRLPEAIRSLAHKEAA
ncbi:MAG: 1-(5-phosphoribosyl)-5-[(5-phosphoribosylamino)methylideneamino]imidazole-4-carboxamide isomerase [Roseiflexaceae bacterium]|nr:1-(5-phosphoribosyl)-5-[(5-phosphoribosylamino)methylideneamino]imidazole-4-carboxamide isomerase [Roseiflexaceae bacterium]